MFKFFKIYLLTFTLFISAILVSPVLASTTAGTIDATNKYAWTENLGWIDFGSSEGSVQITDSALTGYAWSENTGWISLNCSNDTSCGTVDYKIANDGAGTLSGYAWGENVGWIDFDPTGGGVTIDSAGDFAGYAWGENVGWIVFNCSTTNSCGTVSYKVNTDYRPQSARPACNNATDDDNDGKTDYPTDPGCSSLTDTNETDPSTGGIVTPPPPPSLGTNAIQISSSIIINNTNNVSLKFNVTNAMQMAISERPDFANVSWENYASNKNLKLSSASIKKLYVKFRTALGGVSEVQTIDITSGITTPTTPTTPTKPASSITTVAKYIFTKFLNRGTNGTEVTQLQQLLQKLNFLPKTIVINGFFGGATELAVKGFQKAHQIAQLGYVGPGTRAALNAISVNNQTISAPTAKTPPPTQTPSGEIFKSFLNKGSSGEEVQKLQLKLKELGYFPANVQITTTFGPTTEKAVKDFQKANGIDPVGYVGPATRKSLNSK